MATPITALLGTVFEYSDAAVLGSQAIETSIYTGIYTRKRRSHNDPPFAKRVRQTGGIRTRPAGPAQPTPSDPYQSPGRKRAQPPSTVTPSPASKRPNMSTYTRHRSINHATGDQSHGLGERSGTGLIRRQNERCCKLYVSRLALPYIDPDIDMTHTANKGSLLIKGWKIHKEFHGMPSDSSNQPNPTARGSASHMGPCIVNWALLQFKCPVLPAGEGETVDRPHDDLVAKFFTEEAIPGQYSAPFIELPDKMINPDPSQPFDQSDGYAAAWNDKWIHGSLNNKNVEWKVLCRKRLPIQQIKSMFNGDTNQKCRATIHQYFRMPQRVYLEQNNPNTWQHPIYEVWWYTPINLQGLRSWPTENSASADQFESFTRTTCYYKELTH